MVIRQQANKNAECWNVGMRETSGGHEPAAAVLSIDMKIWWIGQNLLVTVQAEVRSVVDIIWRL